jgi:hypothetical protein
MKVEYRKLATAIAIITIAGCFIKAYDRFTTVEAMANQSVKDRGEDMMLISSDLSEIKSAVKDTNEKIDEFILKSK